MNPNTVILESTPITDQHVPIYEWECDQAMRNVLSRQPADSSQPPVGYYVGNLTNTDLTRALLANQVTIN
jgi:hypothetical protein